jgi:hypothetical protein
MPDKILSQTVEMSNVTACLVRNEIYLKRIVSLIIKIKL